MDKTPAPGGSLPDLPAAPPREGGALPTAPPQSIPPANKPPHKKHRRTRPIEIALLALSMAIVVALAALAASTIAVGSFFGGLFTGRRMQVSPPDNSFSVIRVMGTIRTASGGAFGMNEPPYLHTPTVEYIRQLADYEGDRGILLYMNTPGGGVFESDEVYRALMQYKEKTGRPVWVYMHTTCASGGYYIAMAAEKLVANYGATTGSIGVYIQLTDLSGLYEKLGMETVLLRSGDNKGIGVQGVPITEEQRAVYQSIVDESYERFLQLVMDGRGMHEEIARPLADGRPYTAQQALDNGLVDELGEWQPTLEAFSEKTGAEAYYPSFSTSSPLGSLLSGIFASLPKNETELALDAVEDLPSGVPMAYAPGLGW